MAVASKQPSYAGLCKGATRMCKFRKIWLDDRGNWWFFVDMETGKRLLTYRPGKMVFERNDGTVGVVKHFAEAVREACRIRGPRPQVGPKPV